MFNNLLLVAEVGVSLALSSSYSHLILVLAATSSAWGFKTLTVLLSKVFKGPIAALLAAMFLGIVVKVLDNFG